MMMRGKKENKKPLVALYDISGIQSYSEPIISLAPHRDSLVKRKLTVLTSMITDNLDKATITNKVPCMPNPTNTAGHNKAFEYPDMEYQGFLQACWGGETPPQKISYSPPKFVLTLFLFTLSPLPLGYSPPQSPSTPPQSPSTPPKR